MTGNKVDVQNVLRDVFRIQLRKNYNSLARDFLIILEDLRDNNYNINEDSYSVLRKKILDCVNNSLRVTEDEIDKIESISSRL